MGHFRMVNHYEAPIERVFELVADYKRYPEWSVSYDEVRDVTGPVDQVGTRIHAVTRFLGRRIEGWSEVAEADPPRMLKLRGTGEGGSRLNITYHLTPTATGTDLEFEADYELPAGFIGQIADKRFVERAVERDMRHSNENFTALVERPAPGPAQESPVPPV